MSMLSRCVVALGAMAAVHAVELTPENWDEMTAGKTAFIKFLAPWCGHCKSMKPAWDKLMKEYKGSKTVLIADVDCTADGKPLCESNGVEGFPTIKHGDVTALEAYEGGRDFDSLSAFAKENLKPSCSPSNIDLCDADKKKEIEALQKLSPADLEAKIEEKDQAIKDADEHFQTELKKLQAHYEELEKAKKATIEEVKESGLGLMKAVKAANSKKDGDSEEL